MNDSTPQHRRTFLKVAAGGALGATTGGLVAGAAAQEHTSGKLVFTYDDGVTEDFTQAYQEAHKPESVPACAGVVSSRVGDSGALSESQLDTLTGADWEIMSHTVRHRNLATLPVTRPIEAGDTRIYSLSNLHGKIAGDTLRITGESASAVVTVAGNGSDSAGEYIELEEPVGTSFSADGTVERYTDEVIRHALRDSRSELEAYGIEVTDAVMPYGGFGERTQELVSEYYTAVANGGADSSTDVPGDQGLNPTDGIHDRLPYLSRRYFRRGEMSRSDIRAFLDRVRDEDVLGILGGHSWHEDLPPERIRFAIQEAKARDIEITTIRSALEDLGSGQTTTTTTEDTTTTTDETATTTDETATTTDETATTTQTSTSTTTTSTTTEGTTTTTTEDTTTTTTTEDPTTTTTASTTTTTSTTTEDPTSTTTTSTTTQSPTTTETTTRTTETTEGGNGGGDTGGGGSGGGDYDDDRGGNDFDWGGGDDDSDSTTTTTTTTTRTPTATPTTTETTTPTERALMTETPTTTETPTATATTTTETPLSAEMFEETTTAPANPSPDVPGFGWVASLGAFGSLAAYALSQLDPDDEE